jgi:hypothetical protein
MTQQSAHSLLDDPDQTDTVPASQSASPLFDQSAARGGVANPQEEQFQPQRDGTDHDAVEEEPQAHSATAAAVQPPADVVDDEVRRNDQEESDSLSDAAVDAVIERKRREDEKEERRKEEEKSRKEKAKMDRWYWRHNC